MAATLKLVRRLDTSSDIDTLDLLNYNDGIAAFEWVPHAVGTTGGVVTETINLRTRGTGPNDMAAIQRAIDDKIEQVNRYKQGGQQNSVWLRDQAEGESNARQSWIREIRAEPASAWHDIVARRHNRLTRTIAIERNPGWESTSIITAPVNNIPANGGQRTLEATILGTMPGRIARTYIVANTSTSFINEIWLGFRGNEFGNFSNFASEWKCEDGIAKPSVDTTLTPGTGAVTTFATVPGMADRFSVRVRDVTTNEDDQRGTFRVLLSAKAASGAVMYVQLKDGIYPTLTGSGIASKWNTHTRTKIEGTSFKLYNLGEVTFPSSGRGRSGAVFMRRQSLRMAAQRVTGSGSDALTCERFYLIPVSEGFLHIDNLSISTSNTATIRGYPEGTFEGWLYTTGIVTADVGLNPINFAVPTGTVELICAAQTATEHTKTDNFDITFSIYPRYHTMRGSG